ncbi:hypothetical protein [Bradyrhizobium sp. JYMT SZCCT0428]|uniref:hypothetical protein n=1 Tax=Bradyrhizobium sp. JYMT SZCCT0428 TaxID=2807673 RepID=UPI001BAD19FB|nr:hypothetical protein [Bradyrhizobium sp. JYMT SZCCT0428]MBR1156942.1 hypothetical protein [Bradyrhizobium sp. JYMT SZCCT0428]
MLELRRRRFHLYLIEANRRLKIHDANSRANTRPDVYGFSFIELITAIQACRFQDLRSENCVDQATPFFFEKELKMKALPFAIAAVAVFNTNALAQNKAGAVGEFSDGTTVVLPDCRTCKVKQTGPNEYEVRIPKDVRNKIDGTQGNQNSQGSQAKKK